MTNPISELYHKSRYNTTIGLVEKCLDGEMMTLSDFTSSYLRLFAFKPQDVDIDLAEFFADPSMLTVTVLAAIFISLAVLFEVGRYVRKLWKTKTVVINDTDNSFGLNASHFDFNSEASTQRAQKHGSEDDMIELNRQLKTISEQLSSIQAHLRSPENQIKDK